MMIDGKALAAKLLQEQKDKLSKLGGNPTLTVITIGDDPASKVYVSNKRKAAEQVGLKFEHVKFTDTTSYTEILETLIIKNHVEKGVAGIIIQLPIVSKVLTEEEKRTLPTLVTCTKDVDGFNRDSLFTPCTPKGIMYMLENIPNYKLQGKVALVIGRSDIVGKPVAKLLLDKNCTVMQAHSKTSKERLLRMFSFADIVVSAVGRPSLITDDDAYQYWKDNRHDFYGQLNAKKDRVIIDVGINRDSNGKLCGDFSEWFKQFYSEHYTPVPGGVGPMTVAMLITNTIEAYERQQQKY